MTKMQVRRYLGLFPSLADLLPQGDPNEGRWEHVKASAETIVRLLSGESELPVRRATRPNSLMAWGLGIKLDDGPTHMTSILPLFTLTS